MTSGVIGIPQDELSTLERVQQLQALIEQAHLQGTVSGGGQISVAATGTGTGASGFASALSAAQAGEPDGAQADVAEVGSGSQEGQYQALVEQAAARYGLDPAVLHGLIQQESGFDPDATSSAGAAGLTQLMPGTASSLGVANPLDPAESIEGGARYLSQLMAQFGGDTADALAAYNAGPGAVQRYGGVPPYPETESYVSKVLGYAESYRQSHSPSGVSGSVL